MRLLARTLLLIGLIAAVPAVAQTDPPARVGRVSLISGTLAFFGPGDADWSAAKVNLPVAVGAWLATDPQSRAEIRVGSESVNLAHDTQLNFVDLRDQVMQLALTQGRLDLHLRRLQKDNTAEIDIPRGGVWLLEPGVYDVDTGGPDQPTRIMVFEGSARFAGGGIDTVVNAGDALVLTGTDTLTATVERGAPDEFVRWCRSHDYHEQRLAAPYRVSPRMTGYEELDAYGEWAEAPDYGAVWYPKSLPADWAPYREGRWVWIEPWGWNWVDDEPWGFAPYHYGRWARIEDRWAWVPGEFVEEPVYAPALVAFIPPPTIESAVTVPIDAGPPVGWFPLAPGEVYWPSYSRDPAYIRDVNITNVSAAVLNTVIAARPASADPPPQVVRQQFANRTAATVVPARALVGSAPVAKAAVTVAPQVLQRAAATVQPPAVVARPSMTAASAGAPTTTAPWHGRDRAPSGEAGQQAASQPVAAAPSPAHPPARPNFAQLPPAPRVGHAGAANTQSASAPPSAQATHRPEMPSRSIPQAGTQVVPPAATAAHPPGPPDFAHLPPARIGPNGIPHSSQQPATAGAPQPSAEHANAPQPPASGTTMSPARPQAPPDFARLPPHRGAPQPAAQPAQLAQPNPNEVQQRANAAAAAQQRATAQAEARQQVQQRAAAEAIARQEARQRAAAEAAARQQEAQQRAATQQRATAEAARQQAQQRAAAQAEARQQAQQRAATEAAARQEAQRRAAAESAARQQAAAQAAQQRAAAEASARQQAQQRAAADAAARQQAAAAQQRAAAEAAARQQAAAATQQRAAAQAAATQQAQQRAAAQAAARQHQAQACGHPGQPACPH